MFRQILLLSLSLAAATPAAAQSAWSFWVGAGQQSGNDDVSGTGAGGRVARYDTKNPVLNLTAAVVTFRAGPWEVETEGSLARQDVTIRDSTPGTPGSVNAFSGRLAVAAVRLTARVPLAPGGAEFRLGLGPALVHRFGSAWSGVGGRTDPGASVSAALHFTVGGIRWRTAASAVLYQEHLSSPSLTWPSRLHHDVGVTLSARIVHG